MLSLKVNFPVPLQSLKLNHLSLSLFLCLFLSLLLHLLATNQPLITGILLNDCRSGTCHTLSVTVTEFSLDSSRVAFREDSRGATLAAMLCQKLARKEGRHLSFPCTQLLIYPVPTDGRFQTAFILVKSCCGHIVLWLNDNLFSAQPGDLYVC